MFYFWRVLIEFQININFICFSIITFFGYLFKNICQIYLDLQRSECIYRIAIFSAGKEYQVKSQVKCQRSCYQTRQKVPVLGLPRILKLSWIVCVCYMTVPSDFQMTDVPQ